MEVCVFNMKNHKIGYLYFGKALYVCHLYQAIVPYFICIKKLTLLDFKFDIKIYVHNQRLFQCTQISHV